MEPKKDILAELDLADLFEKRVESAKRRKETAAKFRLANAVHFFVFWIGGGGMGLAALWVTQMFPENDPTGIFLLSACIISWLALWTRAFFPIETVRRLQDEANAASKQVVDLDNKIAFCHQVLEEAKRVKVRKYANAWVEKDAPSSPPRKSG